MMYGECHGASLRRSPKQSKEVFFMKLAICYFSATGRTETMAKAVAAGMIKAQPDAEVRCISITEITTEQPENIAYVNACQGVVFGTPDYYAGECWQIKKWLDVCPCKLAHKLGGSFATANFPVGGAVVAIERILTHLLVQGMLVFSGGSAFGQPFIHLGPTCYRGQEEDGTRLMEIFGLRFANKARELFG